jgi:hypothetical protein
MGQRKVGITKLYDTVSNAAIADSDIKQLREIHIRIDEAVLEAYALDEEREPQIREFEAKIASAPLPGWREVDLGHSFYDTPTGTRFTISPHARIDILDKLLALNQYRYQWEREHGLRAREHRGKPKSSHGATSRVVPGVDDGALFPLPDSLF